MQDRADPPPAPPVDDLLCFALYAASRAVTARYRPLLDPHGLTYPQYLVLLVLVEEDVATVRRIGARLHLDSGTLSPLLARLEGRGLVVRRRSPSDERAVDVSLTSQGVELTTRLRDVPPVITAATGLEDAEADDLRDRLWRLAEQVAADTAAAGAGPRRA